jgi:probable F420-dependent oxidoreductase
MSEKVGIGIAGFPFETMAQFWQWVDICEAGDVDSIWVTDRLVSAQPMLEPMSVMAALAGRTERIQFGMNVVVLPARDPLVLAKECATIDFMSDGRLLPAFGVGGNRAPEWAATGRTSAGRGRLSDEMLEIMTRLWAGEVVTFDGEFFRYEDAQIAPLPARQPLPLWIGGSSKAAIRRTAELGSGWLSGIATPNRVAPVVAAIRQAVAEAGRTIDDDHYGAGFTFRFGSWDDPIVQRTATSMARFPEIDAPEDYLAVGDASDVIARIGDYRAAGVSKFVARPIASSGAEVIAQTERLIAEVIPAIHGGPRAAEAATS